MINNIKLDIEDKIFKVLIIFTFCIIGSKLIIINEIATYVEFSTVIMIIFSFIFFKKYKTYKRYIQECFKEHRFIYVISSVYFIWNIIILIINFNYGVLLYYINKLIPVVFLLILFPYLKSKDSKKIECYKKNLGLSILMGCTIALIMYIFKYTNGAFSLDKILNLVSFKDSMDLYGEIRLYGLLSHKARFAIYCLIGLIMVHKSLEINLIIKNIAYGIFGICIILSSSMMGIGMYLCILVIICLDKIGQDKLIKYIKENKKKVVTISLIIVIASIVIILFIGTKRDLSTLGHRTYIWLAGINKVLENFWGRGIMPNEFWIEAIHNGKNVYFTNAHNTYINEFIEVGIIGGVLYLGVIGSLFGEIIKRKNILIIAFYILVYGLMMNFESVDIREMKNILVLIYPFCISGGVKIEEVNNSSLYV